MIIPYCLFPKIFFKDIYTIKERVFDFDCCPTVLNSNFVEWMLKGSLACIRKFVESDNEIRVMWNVGDIVCWRCVMMGLWDVGDMGCWECGILGYGIWGLRDVGMQNFGDAGFRGCGMLEIWDVRDVGCLRCGMFGLWDVGCLLGCGMLI